MQWKTFIGGFLLGTIGITILSSREAKQVYSYITAAALHGRDDTVKRAQIISENAGDIYQRAKKINEDCGKYEEETMIRNTETCRKEKEEKEAQKTKEQ
ncbi:MAG TPA: DUF6110 family protein [Lachnospiraceae bacterium]|nr:DUF6110 family protein [Lachnospiraceae bacterium]